MKFLKKINQLKVLFTILLYLSINFYSLFEREDLQLLLFIHLLFHSKQVTEFYYGDHSKRRGYKSKVDIDKH